MTSKTLGSARMLLLAALALAAAVMVTSIAIVALRSSDAPAGSGTAVDDEPTPPLGGGSGRPRAQKPVRPGTEDDEEDPDDPDGIVEWHDPNVPRVPEGQEFWVTPGTLRAAFTARNWEETRRMIDVLQADGGTVPADVVNELLAMLAKEDLRLDAVLALGGVKDDVTGRALADLALSSDAPLVVRQAALDALARSGQKSAVPLLQQLVAAAGTEPDITRHAVFSLAGIGGPDAARTLVDLLAAHGARDDELHDAIVSAIGRAKDIDGTLAAVARAARERGDREQLEAVLIAAQFAGPASGPEVKAELLRIVEGDSALAAFEEGEKRQIVQAIALPAAVSAGIIAPSLRLATSGGPLRDVALHSLRQARGDDAAKELAAAIAQATDETVRRELTVALGETGSTAATATLVTLLDDPSDNIRNAAARGLGQIRDVAAVKAITEHIAKAPPDEAFARSLVVALGTIGANESLATLEKLAASEEVFWRRIQPWANQAIVRIQTGNPESQRLK